MKKRVQNVFLRGLLIAVLIVFLGISSVLAEENVKTGHVDLLIEGKFPKITTQKWLARGNAFDDYMVSMLNAMAEEIDLSSFGLSEDEFHSLYTNLLNAHPELFFVSGGYSWSYDWDGIVTTMWPGYRYPAEELETRVTAFNKKLNEIVSYANQASTAVGKLLRANDYFCINFQYDTSYSIYAPDELFASGKGVCQAYMMGFAAVLSKLGIPNSSVVSDAMNHTWNVIQLDGEWYHVDVTWNDPIPNAPNRAKHDNLLRSNAGIGETGHYGWEPSVAADSVRFDDYFWINVDHPVSIVGDVAYYTPITGTAAERIDSFNMSTGEVATVHRYDFSFGYYFKDVSPVWATSSKLYYGMGDAIYAVPLGGGTPELVFSVYNSDEYMFYIYQSGSEMHVTTYNYSAGEYKGYTFPVDADIQHTLMLNASPLMKEGDQLTIAAELLPPDDSAVITWYSSNPAVAKVGPSGTVTAAAPGVVTISAVCGDAYAECILVVYSSEQLKLADEVTAIEARAFAGTALTEVILPEGLKTIAAGAFEECSDLWLVYVPDSVNTIASDGFSGCDELLMLCTPDSAA